MDCDFELLHSRAMVLPGKKICGEKGAGRGWCGLDGKRICGGRGGPKCPPNSKSWTSYVVSILYFMSVDCDVEIH